MKYQQYSQLQPEPNLKGNGLDEIYLNEFNKR